jgi:hypothetical protein
MDLNATTGAVIWEEFQKREVNNSPTVAASGINTTAENKNIRVYSSNNDDFIHVLNGTKMGTGVGVNSTISQKTGIYGTGSLIWATSVPYKGMLYVGSRDNYLYCFENDNPDWNPWNPMKPQITISADKTQVNKTQSVTVSGCIFPNIQIPETFDGNTLKVTFTRPDNSPWNIQVTPDATGSFNVTYTPDTAGQWNIVAWTYGNHIAYTADSYSNVLPLTVAAPSTPGSSEPPVSNSGIPMEYVYAAVAIIVIVIVAAAALMLMRSRKK